VVAAASLTACGEDKKFTPVEKSGENAGKVLAAAPAKTRTERTARMEMALSSSGKGLLHMSGVTRLDRERGRFQLTYDTSVGGLPAGTKADALMEGNDFYFKFEKRPVWVHVRDAASDSFSTGVSQSFEYLSAVIGNAKFVGGKTTHGERLRVYEATVDTGRVADHLPARERDAYRKKAAKFGIPARLPLTVAIDRRGRISEMHYDVTVRGNSVELLFELYDFGAKGNLTLPKHFIEAKG
jgi:hypothetical protein